MTAFIIVAVIAFFYLQFVSYPKTKIHNPDTSLLGSVFISIFGALLIAFLGAYCLPIILKAILFRSGGYQ